MFPGRLVSLRGDIEWPLYSPDLNPCDFFLWGHLKERVYRESPDSLDALKDAIRRKIQAIPLEMVLRVVANFRERLQACIDEGGRQLKDHIFKI